MIKIVTNTTCNLPPELFERYQIITVPVNIQFGQETFQEGVNIHPDTFHQRIETEGVLPTTSQPSIGQFYQTFEALAADGSEILSIHLTSKISKAWQAAVTAAKRISDRANVTVLDSLTGSVGLGFMMREAAQLLAISIAVHLGLGSVGFVTYPARGIGFGLAYKENLFWTKKCLKRF